MQLILPNNHLRHLVFTKLESSFQSQTCLKLQFFSSSPHFLSNLREFPLKNARYTISKNEPQDVYLKARKGRDSNTCHCFHHRLKFTLKLNPN